VVSILPRRAWRLGAVGATVALLVAVAPATSASAAGAAAAAATGATPYVTAAPVCHQPTPGHAACDAFRLVRTGARTAGARALTGVGRATTHPVGPAGGYTPADLATAYGFNPDAARSKGNVLAIVDAYNDPNIRKDLNAFDAKYGLPAETTTSFRVVGQNGGSRLPVNDASGWSVEEALDVQAARAVCHLCRIVLVETKSSSFYDLAAGVNAATALGAQEISNSYGGPEGGGIPSSVASAYDHKKVVITASTGDDGWHDWDYVNAGWGPTGSPELPSSLNTVVGVGGTALYLNANATRASEQVWNENGPADAAGAGAGPMGATGGGCSTVAAARGFQRGVPGYSSLGCGTRRSATDIAAIADPFTGFDVVSTFDYGGGSPGWTTVGGTSLASPVVAGMWALAGGAQNVDYPALTLYGHARSAPATFDVRVGGNGACGTADLVACKSSFAMTPNAYWHANVDCGFHPNDTVNTGQCYAQKGYDGPSGVGAPKGLGTFAAMAPSASISAPSSVAAGSRAVFTGSASDPFPRGSIASYSWDFGDGHTAVGASVRHTYSRGGKFTVTLKVTDRYGVVGKTTATVTVS
jgi:hypothetical protein